MTALINFEEILSDNPTDLYNIVQEKGDLAKQGLYFFNCSNAPNFKNRGVEQ